MHPAETESNVRVIDTGWVVAITIYHRIGWTSIFAHLLDTRDRTRNITRDISLLQMSFYCICSVGAYRTVYMKRFGYVHFSPAVDCQHFEHVELSVLNSSYCSHILPVLKYVILAQLYLLDIQLSFRLCWSSVLMKFGINWLCCCVRQGQDRSWNFGTPDWP